MGMNLGWRWTFRMMAIVVGFSIPRLYALKHAQLKCNSSVDAPPLFHFFYSKKPTFLCSCDGMAFRMPRTVHSP